MLSLQRFHRHNILILVIKLNGVYASEQLLKMRLNNQRIGRLSKYLQHVIVTNKVEARKRSPLLLQELIQSLLTPLQLIHHILQLIGNVLALNQRNHAYILHQR